MRDNLELFKRSKLSIIIIKQKRHDLDQFWIIEILSYSTCKKYRHRLISACYARHNPFPKSQTRRQAKMSERTNFQQNYLSLKVTKPKLKSENTFSSQVMELVNHKLAFTQMKARIVMNFPPKVQSQIPEWACSLIYDHFVFQMSLSHCFQSGGTYTFKREARASVYFSQINIVCTIKQTILYH